MRFGRLDLVYMVLFVWEALIAFLYMVQMTAGNIGVAKGLIILLIILLVMYFTLFCIFCKEEYNKFVEAKDDEFEDEEDE